MVSSMPGATTVERRANLLNQVREYVASIFSDEASWDWNVIIEIVIDRLEGSRRAKKGTLFEIIVRRNLKKILAAHEIGVTVSESEVRLEDETYDVQVSGTWGTILIPVKTRETMGGGHAHIFTRDIRAAISVATSAGYICIPVVIAESWTGRLEDLDCDDFIYLANNPNQLAEIEPLLAAELEARIDSFKDIE